ncbi:MAG: hemerythrin domain-containing protein [Propionicimonas sp.]|uniref:hemerythrin domain-containing protein n=1 Tax=Propionicimonas sp. TaxID=1955623 RepID=UPI003D0EF438
MRSESAQKVGCDTSDLIMIHNMFRRLYGEAPGLIRGVTNGDTARSEVVGFHIEEIVAGLHIHHHGEDVLLWDRLESRAPACALHVGQMRAQHEAISGLLDDVNARLPAWRSTASAADREELAAAVEAVAASLQAHLGQDEEQIAPVAATTLTQAEWDELAEHGLGAIPRNRLLIQLGAILDALPADERAAWVRQNLPPLPRLLWAVLGKRQYANYLRELYGTGRAA